MPIIEFKYKCSKCDFEGIDDVFLSLSEVSDTAKVRCENCGLKQDGYRVWNTAPAIKFVGPGFYSTDYPKESRIPEKK